ncbi:hypothetical protein [Flavobacterium sp.]|uniref:hypothetical protein n=1 Tax=Flavobacterium sp. TaxID=239 RepID=UPI002613B8FE|nr:hypothetical protein [Flavobacterium sp.]MDG2431127.1 hypothetical protein [Flavobacterium sp.]
MKTLVIILSAIGLLSLSSCNQKSDVKTMLQNSKTRSEIIKTIAENPQFMTEFMANMQGKGMQMMQGDPKMIGAMMQGEGMQMMMKDSTMMHSMMNGMMKDPKMMQSMMQMMHQGGMMSEDCIKSCTKMMGEKGMDMQGMNKLNMPTDKDHTDHH